MCQNPKKQESWTGHPLKWLSPGLASSGLCLFWGVANHGLSHFGGWPVQDSVFFLIVAHREIWGWQEGWVTLYHDSGSGSTAPGKTTRDSTVGWRSFTVTSALRSSCKRGNWQCTLRDTLDRRTTSAKSVARPMWRLLGQKTVNMSRGFQHTRNRRVLGLLWHIEQRGCLHPDNKVK